ncbi:MAG: Peroxidase, partial [Solirubrobacterales bacterium]|nr:Peroxidase [Solirubrobacterales bacterium]
MRLLTCALVTVLAVPVSVAQATQQTSSRTLDGSQNNVEHPDWGQANTPYPRVAAPRYLDSRASPVPGPPVRYISNRIFNDTSQNLFSENAVTQWGAVWGQFLDHTFGLRQVGGGESAPMAFDPADPLEAFRNDLGTLAFQRTPAAPGTGATSPREQVNTVSGYIDASAVYGDSADRLQWLRESGDQGPRARLLLPGGYLPRVDARGDAAAAPPMELFGRLAADPSKAMVAGDARANENMPLTATHTLFALEHNRIVGALPQSLPEEEKFQIARRLVGAEQQFITYHEFLPALGVTLPRYRGYDPQVNAAITNEFAVVGYRAHSMIHGEFEPSVPPATFTNAQLDAFAAQGVEIKKVAGSVVLVVPLNLSLGNPELLRKIGIGPVLRGIGAEPEYKNDEQIDNQLRSVLFQVPKPGTTDPAKCLDGPPLPTCFSGVVDLAATDIERGRDHGMPT